MKVVDAARAALGINVATFVAVLKATVAAINALEGSRNSKFAALMVVASMASLNVAVTAVVRLTPVAALAGATVVTVGGVVSATTAVENTTSTQ